MRVIEFDYPGESLRRLTITVATVMPPPDNDRTNHMGKLVSSHLEVVSCISG